MGEQMDWTPHDLRGAADGFACDSENCLVAVAPTEEPKEHYAKPLRSHDIASMLRFSADSVERLEKVKEICNRIISTKKGKYGIVSYMTLCGLAEEILSAAVGNDGKQK